MSQHRNHLLRAIWNTIYLVCIFALLTSCQGGPIPINSTKTVQRNQTQLPEQPKAEVTFEAQTLTPLQDDQVLFIEIVDEVTGLALNPARVKMEKKDTHTFEIKMPVSIGTVLKYRYVRDPDPFGYEYSSLGQQVRYRLYHVDGPGIVQDTISGWKTNPLRSVTGRIEGHVAYEENKAPVINGLVSAGGIQTLTASDGSFLLEGLPAGLHNLVVYSLDGAFRPFQQGAVVAPESTTPALVLVKPSKMVNITFIISPPEDNIPGLPIRMVGNIYPLGNMFADLDGGVSVIAARAPLLAVLPDGKYSITLKLPAGLDLRYKYTLGDGLWNAERSSTGELRLRQFLVPERDMKIEDSIDTWKTPDRAPISFTLTVPADTPVSDAISIQFNPYGWTEPIPMWPAGNNRWFYILYNPLNSFTSASYRFCRNDQCSTADAQESRGASASGKLFEPKGGEQNIDDAISEWAWVASQSGPVVVPDVVITRRPDGFQAGVKLSEGYHPSWQPFLGPALQNISEIGANTVVLSPGWHMTHQTPPVMAAIPGQDSLWTDVSQMVIQAQQKGLGVVIHPVLHYPQASGDWWQSAARDEGWWQSWFDRYRTYVLYHADLAAQTGGKMLILGDASIAPALPGGVLADGSPSGVPGNSEERWLKLIADLRTRYTGKIAWYVAYDQQIGPVPEFATTLDQLYIEMTGPLANGDEISPADLEASIAAIVDGQILPLQEKAGQPVVLGLKFPSAAGAMDGCVVSAGECLPQGAFDLPVPEYPDVQIDFHQQSEAYTAVLSVINQRSWINGFYAVGYHPAVLLRDMSISMRGKPAGDVLWYWYPRMLGKFSQ